MIAASALGSVADWLGTFALHLTCGLALAWLLTQPGAPLLYYGDEYGDWGGLRLPRKIVQKGGPAGATITFTTVDFDKVDAAVFELPAAVKALVKP